MSEPAWPSPADDPREEAAPTVPEKVERQWLLAWVVLALFALVRYQTGEPAETSSFRLGYAVGAAAIPLGLAWLVSRFWKYRHAPAVVVTCAILLSFGGRAMQLQKIKKVTETYVAELNERIVAWDARCEQNVEWTPEDLLDREELTACIESYNETLALTAKLLAEMESGDVYRDMLIAENVSTEKIEEAWSGVRGTAEFGQSIKVLRVSKKVMTFTMVHLSALDRWHGHWQLASDGTIEFDEAVDSATLGAFNENVEKLEKAVAELGKLIE